MKETAKQKFVMLLSKLEKNKVVIGFLIAILLVTPLFVLSDFRLGLLNRFLIYGILAISLNFLWGYTGILSLGHGLFFSLGAYAVAMHLKLQSTKSGIPDFMEWSGLESLPFLWQPFQSLPFTIAMIVLAPALCALFLGIPSFISGIRGVYFTILTQVATLVVSILFIGAQAYTGGTNGITNLTNILGYNQGSSFFSETLYIITIIVLIIVLVFVKFSLKVHGGKILRAVKDSQVRLRFLGYRVSHYKILFLCTSAIIAGIAGALFVPVVGIISPSSMQPFFSIEIAIWVAVGGRGTLLGPLLGALFVNYSKTFFSESFPEIWFYFYGALFIIATLVFPKGISGLLSRVVNPKSEI